MKNEPYRENLYEAPKPLPPTDNLKELFKVIFLPLVLTFSAIRGYWRHTLRAILVVLIVVSIAWIPPIYLPIKFLSFFLPVGPVVGIGITWALLWTTFVAVLFLEDTKNISTTAKIYIQEGR